VSNLVGSFSDVKALGLGGMLLYDILFVGLVIVSFWLLDKVKKPYNKLVLVWIALCSAVALYRLAYVLWLFVQYAITQ
jgi:hypothetical protein